MKSLESRESNCVSPGEGYKLWAASYDGDLNPLLALEERALRPMLPDRGSFYARSAK